MRASKSANPHFLWPSEATLKSMHGVIPRIDAMAKRMSRLTQYEVKVGGIDIKESDVALRVEVVLKLHPKFTALAGWLRPDDQYAQGAIFINARTWLSSSAAEKLETLTHEIVHALQGIRWAGHEGVPVDYAKVGPEAYYLSPDEFDAQALGAAKKLYEHAKRPGHDMQAYLDLIAADRMEEVYKPSPSFVHYFLKDKDARARFRKILYYSLQDWVAQDAQQDAGA